MIQKMRGKKKVKYCKEYKRTFEALRELDEVLDSWNKNFLYIHEWHFSKHRKLFSKEIVTRRSRNISSKITSAVPGSSEIKDQIFDGLSKWTDLPRTKKGLARHLNKLLKNAGLDKYWVICY